MKIINFDPIKWKFPCGTSGFAWEYQCQDKDCVLISTMREKQVQLPGDSLYTYGMVGSDTSISTTRIVDVW